MWKCFIMKGRGVKKMEKTDLVSQQTCHGTVVSCHDGAHTRMLLRRKAV
jgi:hypothetical protein